MQIRFLRNLLAHRPDLMLHWVISKMTPPPDAKAAGESPRLTRLLHPSLTLLCACGGRGACPGSVLKEGEGSPRCRAVRCSAERPLTHPPLAPHPLPCPAGRPGVD